FAEAEIELLQVSAECLDRHAHYLLAVLLLHEHGTHLFILVRPLVHVVAAPGELRFHPLLRCGAPTAGARSQIAAALNLSTATTSTLALSPPVPRPIRPSAPPNARPSMDVDTCAHPKPLCSIHA